MKPPTLVLCLDNYDFDLLRRSARGREYRRIARIEQVLGMRQTIIFRLPGSRCVLGFDEDNALWSYAETHEIALCQITRERLEAPGLSEWMQLQEQRHAQRFSPPAIGEICLCENPSVSVVMPALAGFDSGPVCSTCRRPHSMRFHFRTR